MFIGEYIHTIDNKGRINIPSKFREKLSERFFITKGLDNCLFVFPESEWNIFEEKLKRLPLTNRNARAFVRLFFSGATQCSIDKQGRVTIPQNLREYGKLEKEIAIIGVSTRIEIWSKDIWDDYNNSANISYDEIAEKMAELGI
ncbi:MraZ protein [Caminicella sporogenes DSM 14501]|uniref:Transcriptional regulator MraZ n=1 Tax=Caminicella sporogenes DSM 14501 TaxID=1121266 RepID=A0A1M6L0S2_9FIRM|nr:division/cell wall cluster transcriptional repressor MraZ [Caminicella sporogenes]RKD27663.1 cell division/cell wall cluster transcriptional repressor MraZ [Caminicella sporogenes]WIF94760.1 division/cell wall cluster transcriptional repressor MraZ [Caminicella sporogenes]SHJ64716.1 MraZ protein [Caminicella sporogenes DSM 14501]